MTLKEEMEDAGLSLSPKKAAKMIGVLSNYILNSDDDVNDDDDWIQGEKLSGQSYYPKRGGGRGGGSRGGSRGGYRSGSGYRSATQTQCVSMKYHNINYTKSQ